MSALILDTFEILGLSLLTVIGIYIVLRVGTLAVLQSIDEFRSRRGES